MVGSAYRPSVSADRRASSSLDWLLTQCQGFSDATGWKLAFRGLEPEQSRPQSQLDWSWYSDVSDVQQRLGTLFLTEPEFPKSAVTHTCALQLADLFAEQVNRYLRACSQVQQQTYEIGALVNPDSVADGDQFGFRLKSLLRASVTLTNYRNAALFLLNAGGNGVRLRFTHHIQHAALPSPDRSFSALPPDLEALQKGQCLVHRGDDRDTEWLPRDATIGVCVPVMNESGPVGTLWLYDRRHHEPEAREIALMRGFGRQVADAFERLVLLRDSATKERLTRELDVVANAVAECLSTTTSRPGCDIAIRCCCHHEVGGDLCEVIPIDTHRTLFVVGDASGDSIPAAVVMTSMRGALHALLSEHGEDLPPLNQMIEVLNQAVVRVTATQQFMSCVFGILDDRTNTFVYSNAGHPPPIFARKGETQVLRSLGMVMGVIDSASYGIDTVQLQADDVLILFSDGILEARDAHQKMFRNDGVIGALHRASSDTAQAILDSIWAAFEEHTGGANHDDRTLLVVRAT